jgi:hypothetical protein
MKKQILFRIVATAASLGVLACGGGGGAASSSAVVTPVPVTTPTVTYANPTAGSYQLVQNAALSNASHLVLDLVGPAGDQGTGVALELQVGGTQLAWTKVASTDALFVQNGALLGADTNGLLILGAPTGATLPALVAQKGLKAPVGFQGTLLRVALDLQSGAAMGTVPLTVNKAQVIRPDGSIATVAVATGTVSLVLK